jgi:hypothetical protein
MEARMTQEMLIEEVKRIRDPEVIAALYSYTLFCKTTISKTAASSEKLSRPIRKPHSWSDIVPIEAKSGRSTQEMTDWVRS